MLNGKLRDLCNPEPIAPHSVTKIAAKGAKVVVFRNPIDFYRPMEDCRLPISRLYGPRS